MTTALPPFPPHTYTRPKRKHCQSVVHAWCRQSVLVSATLHQKLGHLADKLLKNPVPVGVAASHSKDGVLVLAEPEDKDVMPAYELPKGLHQLYMDVPVKLRLATLLGTNLSST